ncbi:MAG: 2,3-bisphosphoglycerate-independent phosphoglycerate mutase [Candidatus Doudnabacteria bacterium]|jgi:2,3-bisphosphoglycerate-independent phosphoglycerate mutase
MNKKQQIALIILDGWGHRESTRHNAIAEAKTPFYDELLATYPHTLINASEEHVGLPKGQIGNSEIGHMTMGSGRVINTDLVKISQALNAGEFKKNPAFAELFSHVKKYNSTLHIFGLVSPGGIHSHQEHLHGFLKSAKDEGINKIAIHAFTDGRDVAPKSGAEYLKNLEVLIEELGVGYIATISGRFFAMDRDKNWHRVTQAEDAIFHGKGKTIKNKKPSEIVSELYKEGVIDELLEPVVLLDDSGRDYKVQKNDGIFFFNFRADRARQLSEKVLERKTSHNLCFVTLTQYDKTFESLVAFPPNDAETTLAAEISQAGLAQSHIAETEKYPHVTYFFNAGREEPHKNERHILVESRRDIHTHDQAPEMRAREIADKAIERIEAGDDFLVINFANADMVGHTANKPAIIIAVETVDRELKRVVEKLLSKNGAAIITADHGNAEVNVDELTGENHTAHTTSLVPFILANPGARSDSPILRPSGSLADIAPTILELLQIKKPVQMTGKSLLS